MLSLAHLQVSFGSKSERLLIKKNKLRINCNRTKACNKKMHRIFIRPINAIVNNYPLNVKSISLFLDIICQVK